MLGHTSVQLRVVRLAPMQSSSNNSNSSSSSHHSSSSTRNGTSSTSISNTNRLRGLPGRLVRQWQEPCQLSPLQPPPLCPTAPHQHHMHRGSGSSRRQAAHPTALAPHQILPQQMCPFQNGSVSAAEAAAALTLLSPQQLNSLTHVVRRQLVAPRLLLLLLLLLPPGLLLLLLLCSSRCLPSKVVTAQNMLLLLLLPLALMLSQGTPHQMLLLLLLWPTVWTGWMQLLAGLVVAPGAAPHCTVWMAWGYWHVR